MVQTVKNLPTMQETRLREILGQGDPLEKGMATHPVLLPGEFHGQRSLVLPNYLQGLSHIRWLSMYTSWCILSPPENSLFYSLTCECL